MSKLLFFLYSELGTMTVKKDFLVNRDLKKTSIASFQIIWNIELGFYELFYDTFMLLSCFLDA